MAKIVKKCRRCGHTFEEKRLSPIKVQASNESYVEHRYCGDEARGARVRPAVCRRRRARRHSGRRADCEVMGWKSRA